MSESRDSPHYSVSGTSFGQPYSSVGKLGRRTGSGPDMNADTPNQAEHDLAVTRLLRSGGAGKGLVRFRRPSGEDERKSSTIAHLYTGDHLP